MFALDALERVVPELALTEAKWLQHDPVKWVRTTAKEAIEDIMLRDISPGESPIRQGCDDIADLIFVRDGGGEIELF